METLLAWTIGLLFALSIYLFLQRSIVRVVMGAIILSQVANLFIFECGRLVKGHIPILKDPNGLTNDFANPLPQALILTAIVISFAILSFALVLIYKTTSTLKSDDMNDLAE